MKSRASRVDRKPASAAAEIAQGARRAGGAAPPRRGRAASAARRRGSAARVRPVLCSCSVGENREAGVGRSRHLPVRTGSRWRDHSPRRRSPRRSPAPPPALPGRPGGSPPEPDQSGPARSGTSPRPETCGGGSSLRCAAQCPARPAAGQRPACGRFRWLFSSSSPPVRYLALEVWAGAKSRCHHHLRRPAGAPPSSPLHRQQTRLRKISSPGACCRVAASGGSLRQLDLPALGLPSWPGCRPG